MASREVTVPSLPQGFVLDSQQEQSNQQGVPEPPPGFVLDQGQQQASEESMFSGDVQAMENRDMIPSPVNAHARFEMALAKTPQGQLNIAQKHLGLNAELRADGKVLVNDIYGNKIPVTPDAKGWTNFFKDFGGRMSELTAQNLPMAGQIVGDVAGTVATGNPVVGIAAGAAGAGGAEALRQQWASELGAGEESGVGDIAAEAGIAAAGGTLGEFAAKPLLKGGAKLVGKIIGKVQDSTPELFKMIGDVNPKNTEYVVKGYKAGRALSGSDAILSDEKAAPEYLVDTVHKTFFSSAENKSPEAFINTYNLNLKRGTSGEIVDAMYQAEHGISQSSLDAMKIYPAKEIMSPNNTGDEAIRNFSKDASETFKKMAKRESDIFSSTRNEILNEKGHYNIPIKNESKQTLDRLVDNGMFETDGNGNYFKNEAYKGTKKSQDLYYSLFKELQSGKLSSLKSGTSVSQSEMKQLLAQQKGALRVPESIKAADLDRIERHNSTAFDSLFAKEERYNRENAPMAEFLGGVRDSMNNNIKDARWSAMNERYTNFKNAQTLFGKMSDRSLESEISGVTKLKNALQTDDKQIKAIYQDYLSRADRFIGDPSEKLTPKFNKLGAGQELASKDLVKSTTTFEKKLSSVNNDNSAELKQMLEKYDESLPGQTKFMRNTQDHLASKDFSKPQTLYKTRVVGFLMGQFLGFGHGPAGIAASMATGALATNPTRLASLIPISETVRGGAGKLAKEGLTTGQSVFARQIASGGLRKSLKSSSED